MMSMNLAGCGGSDPEPSDPDAEVQPVADPSYDPDVSTDLAVQSNNGLAVALYRELAKQGGAGDNLFFSPMSVSAALMLTYEGSRGDTQAAFEKILMLDSADNRLDAHKSYAGVLGRLTADENAPYELSIANALWAEQTMPLSDSFIQTLQTHYAASLESVDFKGDADNQRNRINAWVSDRTRDRINDLLPEGSVNGMTRVVLANAMYFKGPWTHEFKKRHTQDAAFYLLPDSAGGDAKEVSVPMMRHYPTGFRYAEMDGYAALSLPYKKGDLSMVVLLPDDRAGLPALEGKLDTEMLSNTFASMKYEKVHVWLPKWETTQDYSLVEALEAMGMAVGFDQTAANFSGMNDSSGNGDLFISDVFHKAFIAVDEAGTEAAAATAVIMERKSESREEVKIYKFRADHPFVYIIRDERTGAILFMGRVTDPS